MAALKAVFGSMYVADLETHAMFIPSESTYSSVSELYTDDYDSLTDMLIHEMVERESDLSDNDLKGLAEMLSLSLDTLRELLPKAKEKLYNTLVNKVEMQLEFS